MSGRDRRNRRTGSLGVTRDPVAHSRLSRRLVAETSPASDAAAGSVGVVVVASETGTGGAVGTSQARAGRTVIVASQASTVRVSGVVVACTDTSAGDTSTVRTVVASGTVRVLVCVCGRIGLLGTDSVAPLLGLAFGNLGFVPGKLTG